MWTGYFLIVKPAALTMAQWTTALNCLAALLGKSDGDTQPFKRLHYRLRLDNQAIILAATFDPSDLDATDLTRLCTYISNCLSGAFTPAQVKTALIGNTTIFGGVANDWETSRQACVAYLATNAVAWGDA